MRRDILATMVLGWTLASAPGEEFDLSWHSIDGGGVIHSTGGDFELSGTIGQPDAGTMTGGTFELTGGFWFETPPGDCNEDGGTSLVDHESFVDCISGPLSTAAGACRCFDVDGSGSVDLIDFSKIQTVFSGP